MSSPSLATTCAARQWQCEQHRIQDANFKRPTLIRLGAIARWFDLNRRVLLMSKVLPCSAMAGATRAILSDISFLQRTPPGRGAVENAEAPRRRQLEGRLPEAYGNAGIARVRPSVLLLWSPHCVAEALSSHARRNPSAFRAKSDEYLVLLAALHRDLRRRAVPVLAINYGDLLWRRHLLLPRLRRALPCLAPGGILDAQYVPKLGTDIFEENQFKSRGSVASFARNHDPGTCCGYSAVEASCRMDGAAATTTTAAGLGNTTTTRRSLPTTPRRETANLATSNGTTTAAAPSSRWQEEAPATRGTQQTKGEAALAYLRAVSAV